jgi:hypothetical protein
VKISAAFPSKWLKAEDLNGREVRVKIQSCAMEAGGEGENAYEKPVLFFVGKQKGLMLNKTNATMIADAYGDDTDDWVGKEIIVHPDRVAFQGKVVDCLRVRTPIAKPENGETEPGF